MKKLLCGAALLALGTAAHGETIGFGLTISGDPNGPLISIVNSSDIARIVSAELTLGNTAYNFDCVTNPAGQDAGSFAFLAPEVGSCYPGGGQRPDSITATFTAFDPGETFSFNTDIDPDSYDGMANFGTALLPGGTFLATFAGGYLDGPLSVSLSDPNGPGLGFSYVASIGSQNPTVPGVPLPASGLLILGSLGALAGIGRRRS